MDIYVIYINIILILMPPDNNNVNDIVLKIANINNSLTITAKKIRFI